MSVHYRLDEPIGSHKIIDMTSFILSSTDVYFGVTFVSLFFEKTGIFRYISV